MGNVCSSLCPNPPKPKEPEFVPDTEQLPDEKILQLNAQDTSPAPRPQLLAVPPKLLEVDQQRTMRRPSVNFDPKKTIIQQTMIQIRAHRQFSVQRNHGKHFNKQSMAFLDLPCRSKEDVFQLYQFQGSVGKGEFGKVFLANLKSDTSRTFAIKVIDQTKDINFTTFFLNEIEMLKEVDHPNIIKFFEVYESEQKYFLVQEFCAGGTLSKRMKQREGQFEETEIQNLFWQILLSTNYLHNKQIAHRDIKPDNFMYTQEGGVFLQLIDLGLSESFFDQRFDDLVGTPSYMSPQVYDYNFNEKCDIWSIGVILYEIMTTNEPFPGEDFDDIQLAVRMGCYDEDILRDLNFSDELIDLLSQMLEYEEDDRISASDALHHPFFAQKVVTLREQGLKLIDLEMLDNLRNFTISSVFQREMIGLMVQAFNDAKELRRINTIFMAIDKDFSGTLNSKDLQELYLKMGMPLKIGDIERIIDSLYITDRGVVSFLEFQAQMLEQRFYTDEKRIELLFNFLDWDASGFIDSHDINNCFRRFGRNLDDRKILQMISECDVLDKDAKISFNEFKQAISRKKKVF